MLDTGCITPTQDASVTALTKARALARCIELVRRQAMEVAFDQDRAGDLDALGALIGDLRRQQERWLAAAGMELREAA